MIYKQPGEWTCKRKMIYSIIIWHTVIKKLTRFKPGKSQRSVNVSVICPCKPWKAASSND